jgi:hypothetical protein
MPRQTSDELTYESLSADLVANIPELEPDYRKLRAWWGDEAPGPHIVFGDILNPYIDRLVRTGDEAAAIRVFSYLEGLSHNSDPHIRDVVVATVCEYIASDPSLVAGTRGFMGESTRQSLKAVMEWKSHAGQ